VACYSKQNASCFLDPDHVFIPIAKLKRRNMEKQKFEKKNQATRFLHDTGI
jgi:hypothetical protein